MPTLSLMPTHARKGGRLRKSIVDLLDSNEWPWLPPRWGRATPVEQDVRKLRIIAHQFNRTDRVAKQGWTRVLIQAAVWPLWAMLKSIQHCNKYPQQSGSVGVIWDTYWQYLTHNIRPSDGRNIRLDRPVNHSRIREFICENDLMALHSLSGQFRHGYPEIENKHGFDRFVKEHGLSAVSVISRGCGDKVTHHQPWPVSDLFFKPSFLGCGIGTEVFKYEADQQAWRTKTGEIITPDTIGAYTQRTIHDTSWVLQPALRHAPAWQGFSTGALCTCRIVTGRSSKDSEPFLIGALMRFPVGDMIVDNISRGGMGASIDISNGKIGCGFRWTGDAIDYLNHPDTNTRIEGEPLPGWTELSQLCLDAHRAAGDWGSIGWDASLTSNGPMLIEANLYWGTLTDIPLSATRWMDVMKSHFGPDLKYSDAPAQA